MRFSTVYLFGDRDDEIDDSNLKMLVKLLNRECSTEVFCPRIMHMAGVKKALQFLEAFPPKADSLIVGIGVGGLLAAKLQELHPELCLSVIAVNSPTKEGVELMEKPSNRVAVYCSEYKPIAGRCQWGKYAEAFNTFNTLAFTHGAYLRKYILRNLITSYMRNKHTKEYVNLIPLQAID